MWPHVKFGWRKVNGVHLEEEKGMTLKFVDAGSNNRNEREGNIQHGMSRQRRMGKKFKIKTLGRVRCVNIETMYININIIII